MNKTTKVLIALFWAGLGIPMIILLSMMMWGCVGLLYTYMFLG